jgi:calmodulin
MAIKNMNTVALQSSNMATRALDGGMTVDEFKEWIKFFDVDKDGRISRQELRRAIKVIHGRFSGWKSSKGIRAADTDGDGYIEEDEIDNLIDFAQRKLGLKIVAY